MNQLYGKHAIAFQKNYISANCIIFLKSNSVFSSLINLSHYSVHKSIKIQLAKNE